MSRLGAAGGGVRGDRGATAIEELHCGERDPDAPAPDSVLDLLRQQAAELTGRRHTPALLLLAELLAVAEECHQQTPRQLRWANAKIKEISAQTMVIG